MQIPFAWAMRTSLEPKPKLIAAKAPPLSQVIASRLTSISFTRMVKLGNSSIGIFKQNGTVAVLSFTSNTASLINLLQNSSSSGSKGLSTLKVASSTQVPFACLTAI